MTEEQQFRVVFGFLGRIGAEVSGRVAFHEDLGDRLRLLADGALVGNQQEQDQILAQIAGDSEALMLLADYLKR
jgi:hypothetical protein